jgi:hypothetical protein
VVLGCALLTVCVWLWLWLIWKDTACRCQKQHHAQHKNICKEYSNNFLHCVVCDRTSNAKTCTICYKAVVCDRNDCVQKHHQTGECVAPNHITETAVIVNATHGEGDTMLIPCQDGTIYTGTMKNILSMLMSMHEITVLTDRVCLVYVTFGGVIAQIPDKFDQDFECVGPHLGVTFEKKSTHNICTDGVYRTAIPTLRITAGGGGPWFNMEHAVPLQVGTNLIKLVRVVVPLANMTQRASG